MELIAYSRLGTETTNSRIYSGWTTCQATITLGNNFSRTPLQTRTEIMTNQTTPVTGTV
jgi:hypothetical protein